MSRWARLGVEPPLTTDTSSPSPRRRARAVARARASSAAAVAIAVRCVAVPREGEHPAHGEPGARGGDRHRARLLGPAPGAVLAAVDLDDHLDAVRRQEPARPRRALDRVDADRDPAALGEARGAARRPARRRGPGRRRTGRCSRCWEKTSASPSVATVRPTAPWPSWSRAISGDLWVFTCGRSASRLVVAHSAVRRTLRRSRSRSTRRYGVVGCARHISSWLSGSPPKSRPSGRAERRDGGDLVVGELEAVEVEVLALPGGRRRLGDRQRAELELPAQDHLARRHAVGLGGVRPPAAPRTAPAACPSGLHDSVTMPSRSLTARISAWGK